MTMEQSLIDRVIAVCKDDTYDKPAKSVILKELLRLFHVNEMQWKSPDPSKGGEYMPEGDSIIAYDAETNIMVTGCRYSSHGGDIMAEGGWKGNTTHWMKLPELPIDD